MIPPPIAIPLTYSPPPLPGWGLSLFPCMSPNAQIRPYTARPALPPCDTLACGRRAYKRPTRQRQRNQWFQSLRTTTQCAPATGPPSLALATGPPSLATGPPCARNKRFIGLPRQNTGMPCAPLRRDHAKIRLEPIPAKTGVGALPEFARNLTCPVPTRPSRRGPRPNKNQLHGNTPRNPPRNSPQICRPIPAPRNDKGKHLAA